jgi:RNA recognition motif. (a.k.a. RRM, RBD, or RNP domain)
VNRNLFPWYGPLTRWNFNILNFPHSLPTLRFQAIALTGQRLLGVPIVVQPTQAEKNRLAGSNMPAMSAFGKGPNGPMRLYVGSLHFNITEDMLRSIFEPFGKIEHMQLMIDTETGRSKGYGFITVLSIDVNFLAEL